MDHIDESQLLFGFDNINWDGGDLHWTGLHTSFCEVCGGAKETLYGCQTCGMSIHASCMTPTPTPEELPALWFCPHCTDNGFHVPPASLTASKPTSSADTVGCDPSYSKAPSKSISDFSELIHRRSNINRGYPTPPTPVMSSLEQAGADVSNEPSKSVGSSVVSAPLSIANDLTEIYNVTVPSKRSRLSTSKTTTKKKSKYSAYSSEVDKALSIIHSELEVAAGVRRSETELRDQIRSLEQQLKLQENQMTLLRRESELAKRALDVEKFKVNRLTSLQGPSVEVTKMKEELTKKDEELVAWKEKLKALVG